jgi:hypothetical protein
VAKEEDGGEGKRMERVQHPFAVCTKFFFGRTFSVPPKMYKISNCRKSNVKNFSKNFVR